MRMKIPNVEPKSKNDEQLSHGVSWDSTQKMYNVKTSRLITRTVCWLRTSSTQSCPNMWYTRHTQNPLVNRTCSYMFTNKHSGIACVISQPRSPFSACMGFKVSACFVNCCQLMMVAGSVLQILDPKEMIQWIAHNPMLHDVRLL